MYRTALHNRTITVTREVMFAFACQMRTFGFTCNQLFYSGTSTEKGSRKQFSINTIRTNSKNVSLFKHFVDHVSMWISGLYLECRVKRIEGIVGQSKSDNYPHPANSTLDALHPFGTPFLFITSISFYDPVLYHM